MLMTPLKEIYFREPHRVQFSEDTAGAEGGMLVSGARSEDLMVAFGTGRSRIVWSTGWLRAEGVVRAHSTVIDAIP